MARDCDDMAWLAAPDGTITVGYGPFTPASDPPPDRTAFYAQDFSLSKEQPWQIPDQWEIIDGPVSSRSGLALLEIEWQSPDADPFARVFQEIMSSIRRGTFEKTVPVVVERGTSSSLPSAHIRQAMWRQQSPLMSYGWTAGSSGFAGATPELLFSLREKTLTTMALAGTARIEDRGVFAVDEKEIREHEYVAQTLAAKLLEYGSVRREEREILSLGSIVHFLTRFRVDLQDAPTPAEWIRRLHPTPALGPLPRTPSTIHQLLCWRDALGCPSGFGAPFGVWRDGCFQSVVAIRGIWWTGNQLQIPAGCGIIEVSRLVNEWRELRLKREAVKAFLRG